MNIAPMVLSTLFTLIFVCATLLGAEYWWAVYRRHRRQQSVKASLTRLERWDRAVREALEKRRQRRVDDACDEILAQLALGDNHEDLH